MLNFRNQKNELKSLIRSFENLISEEILLSIEEYVEYNEPKLALEILSDNIYELSIFVEKKQESEILRLSKQFGVDDNYHQFIGKMPPYPDLRTEKQKAF